MSGGEISRRLFLESREEDDPARARALREFLTADGEPCGSVEAALMLSVGVWTVSCTKGHVHRIVFDQDGHVIESKRLP